MGGRRRPAYPPEFRHQIIELVKAGRTPEELSREFEPTATTLHKWVKQAGLDGGVRSDGLTSSEREELGRLRRENRQLKLEREILKKVAAWFAQETESVRRSIPVREGQPGELSGAGDVQDAGCPPQRVLRVARAAAFAQSRCERPGQLHTYPPGLT